MQASSAWIPPTGTLGGIVAEARARAGALRSRAGELERAADDAPPAPPLAAALRRADVAVIAEVKRRSPSKGWINPSLSASGQASAYETGGAAAISVLTEPDHFGGSADDLVAVRRAVSVPVLKKDFHVHPLQLVEARALGASGALLIARALSPGDLRRMIDAAAALRLEVIVEIRDEIELDRALDLGATLIGVNNRNLETLAIDLGTSERLIRRMPAGAGQVAIAESGVNGRGDVERAARAGADAVLVGSSLSATTDAAAVRALTGVERVGRGA